MSTDLMQRLADYRDDLDAAIEQHRAAMLVEPIETPRPAGRVVLAAAVVALVAGGIGLVVAVNRDGPSHQPVSGIDDTTGVTVPDSVPSTVPVPSTTIVSDTTWDWLDQFGAEVRQPPVPDGRNVLDFEAFRFAVPADWIVPSALTRSLPAPGFVLIAATEPTMCASGDPPPPSVLSILPASDAGTPGTPTTIGTLSAVEIPPKCVGCAPVYLFDIPYQLSVSGPHAEQVLGTFTNSGFQRVLGRGPQASLGTSRLIPSCAPQIDFDLVPGDGLWIRSTADSQSQPDGTQIAHGVVDGLDVTVAAMHRTVAGAPSPALDLVVRDGSATPIWVSLGVGTDTSIARSILRSLHAVRGGP